jgi:hypothetical protein
VAKQATFYNVSETPVGGLFQGDGERLVKGQLAISHALQNHRRPDVREATERILGRWHSTEIDVVGTFGGGKRGSVAVGQGYLLLTDRYLRGTVTGSGSKNRLLVANNGSYRLRPFSGSYAFLFDLVTDVGEFIGHSKAVGFSSGNAGIMVVDPYVADENWKSKPFALPGKRTLELGTALLEAILQAKEAYGDQQAAESARRVADSDWKAKFANTGRTPFAVKF